VGCGPTQAKLAWLNAQKWGIDLKSNESQSSNRRSCKKLSGLQRSGTPGNEAQAKNKEL